jgi:hypothetical protein
MWYQNPAQNSAATTTKIKTDRIIPNKKPDILIRGNEKEHETYLLADIAIWRDRNVIKNEWKNILKLQKKCSLSEKHKRTWHQ